MKFKTKLKRKDVIGLVAIAIMCLLFASTSVGVFGADDPKITAVNYLTVISPTDVIDISFDIEWGNSYQRIKGDVYVYYGINTAINTDNYVCFAPIDRQATKISFKLDIIVVDGDYVKFQIWFEWGRWTATVGEIESKEYKIDIIKEGFKKDVFEFWHSNKGIIIGSICGLIALAIVVYVGKKRR